jgi:hypothetical protein
MSVVRVLPRVAGMAELHTFECKRCSAILTQVADERPRSGVLSGLLAKGSDVSG